VFGGISGDAKEEALEREVDAVLPKLQQVGAWDRTVAWQVVCCAAQAAASKEWGASGWMARGW
jgi:hypothetical protein